MAQKLIMDVQTHAHNHGSDDPHRSATSIESRENLKHENCHRDFQIIMPRVKFDDATTHPMIVYKAANLHMAPEKNWLL
jgi:hypothetical protein